MSYKSAFHAYSAIPNSSFHAYCAIMDSFVKVCFYVEKHYIPQYALTNKLSLWLFRPIFWSRWLLFRV